MSPELPAMHIKIYAPFKTYFEGEANSVSAANKTGAFDVLPHHKNFMTLLVPCTIIVRTTDKRDYSLNVNRAVMHVKADKVTVFLDI